MSESAYGGESAWGWDRGFESYTEPEVRTIMEIISPRPSVPNYISESQEPQRKTDTKQQEEKQSKRVIRGQQQETTSKKQTSENKTRVIRGPETQEQQEEPLYDIGELRKQVMEELYDEFFTDIKNEVREELLKEKPVIVREITDELREKLKADLRKSFIKSEDGGR